MSKEAFLRQLESSLGNSDKRLFAKTIYDLPADVIVGLTKEEFLRIIYISHKFSSQKMDRLFNLLEVKGLFFLENALKGIDELNNSLLSRFYFSLCISIYEANKEETKCVLANNAAACIKLAEMGFDIKENLEYSVFLCSKARQIYPQKSADYARVLINESNARQKLAERSINSKKNLETVVRICIKARQIYSYKSAAYSCISINEGDARQALAKMGIDSVKNLETAVDLYINSRKILHKTSEYYSRALIHEGNARQTLAEIGIDSRENLEISVCLCEAVKKLFFEVSSYYAIALVTEGNSRQRLAEMGIDNRKNLETAIKLYCDAKEIFPETSSYYAVSLMNEGNARQTLAEIGIDSRENLETTVCLCKAAREIFPDTSKDYAVALMIEGNARKRLADIGIDIMENVKTALNFYSTSKEILPEKTADYASVLMNEGGIRNKLAEMGIDSRENLETAVSLCEAACKIFPIKSTGYAGALVNEGNARQKLAEMGFDSKENLETAVNLYINARESYPIKSADYARVLMNEGGTRNKLAEIGVDNRENLEISKKLYLESVSILEELGDGWTYSIALLNLNSLLKENFYKTGNKNYLQEWERNLGDIEEKIKDRDIRDKETVVARIHEIRASLLEFEGKSGINKASREYNKAYELSKDPFYKFMDEFCQARIDTKSFCELVSDWKLEEKKGIFLDYYDYTVFECHLENALESTLNEEDELKLAVEKLKEIKDRTQIKIIKDRVSAYIYLLQALVDCFNNDSYKEAAENVKEGCKIFREYGDKQGQQMCEIFHNAVVRKNPDAWQEIIRKREFSSNFYSLLCEYSDRKRADLESHKLSQIHEVVSRTEEKVDQLQATLNKECAEIKDRIENGFDGTVSELREIKVEINYIQEDFDHLIQVSNNVNGNEREFIREFVTKMLDLMKKGEAETINRFLEEIVKNETSLEETLENSKIPEKEKTEAKSKLADLKKIPGVIKEKMKSFSVDVTKDVVVTLTSNEIIKLLTPVLSTAIFGVPIPSQVVGILLEAIRNS